MSSQSAESEASTAPRGPAAAARKGPRPSPSERARLAGAKRRKEERAGKRLISTPLYISLLVGLAAVWSAFIYRAVQPGPPLPIGEITAPRVQLKDGRHVAYNEAGASADKAKYHVLVLHGWGNSRLDLLPNITVAELQELGVRLVSYDRPGYGQSDPFPGRTAKTEAEDIEQLSELLGMGKLFHLLGISMGGYPAWGCLKYIPKKLYNVGLVNPVGDFWAKNMTTEETIDSWMHFINPDRYSILVAHHFPWFLHFWTTQKYLTRGFWGREQSLGSFSSSDKEILSWPDVLKNFELTNKEAERQGPVESVERDMKILYGKWPFDIATIDISGDGDFDGEVHIWQGMEDYIVPNPVNRYAKRVLPSVKYTEVDDEGHLFFLKKEWSKRILTELLGIESVKESVALPDHLLKTA